MMKKRLLSTLLTVVLLLGMFPATVFAAGGHWADQAVDTLNGIYGENVFSAEHDIENNPMTEGEAYTVLVAMGATSDKVTENSATNLTRAKACAILTDIFNIPTDGKTAIQYLYEQNIINGYQDGELGKDDPITDAQFAVLTFRVLNFTGGGMGSSVAELKPGTKEYFAWMYLAARKAVSFEADESKGNIDSDTWSGWIDKLMGAEIPSDAKPETFNPACPEANTTKLAAAIEIVDAYINAGGSPSIFSDVAPGDWCYDGVMYLFNESIVQGQGNGTFGLQALPRFQLAVLLAVLDNADCANAEGLSRITGSVNYAIEKGYMAGSSFGETDDWSNNHAEWGNNVYVCREDTVVAILKQKKVDVSSANTAILDRFSDSEDISEEAKPYMAYAVSHGLINGTSDNKLLPKVVEGNQDSKVTRPQIGVLTYRVLIGLDTTKMQDYRENVDAAKSVAATYFLRSTPSNTLTLREDWRLTSELDLEVPAGTTLSIDGQGKYHIYELGGTLQNSGLGVVKFEEGTILYPATSTDLTSDQLMLERQPHAITIADGITNGTITVDKDSAKMGETITITATPASDAYTLDADTLTITAIEANNPVVEVNNNTFTMPASDVTVTATFKVKENGGDTPPTTYTVTVNDSYAASNHGAGSYAEGATVTINAGSMSNYTFSGWTASGVTLANSNSATTTFTMPANAVTVTANWSYNAPSSSYDDYTPSVPTYNVSTPSRVENGSVSVSAKNPTKGSTVTLTVTPDEGYELDTLIVTDKNGNEIVLTDKGNGKFSFTMPDSKVNIKATFIETPVEPEAPVNPFYDVAETDYFFDAVLWANENGITSGVGDGQFTPHATCTRAQMVTFLWNAAGCPNVSASYGTFTDVTANDYYYKAVLWAKANGITSGTGEDVFSPERTCDRAQMATFLYKFAEGQAVGSSNRFADVTASDYYAKPVQWAVENGITDGTGANTFGPADPCTRAQMVTFLYRLLAD